MFDKKVTAALIGQYLAKLGISHQVVGDTGEQSVVICVMPAVTGTFMVVIEGNAEQRLLHVRVGAILKAPLDETPADRLSGLLLVMSSINYRLPMGAFGFDPSDGEVALSCSVPIDSNDLRFEDFRHVMLALTGVLDKHAAELRSVADGSMQAEEVLA